MNCRTKRFSKGVGKFYSGGIMQYNDGGTTDELKPQTVNYGRENRNRAKNDGTLTVSQAYDVNTAKGTQFNDLNSTGEIRDSSGALKQPHNKNMQVQLNQWRDKVAQAEKQGLLPEQIKQKFAGVVDFTKLGVTTNYNVKLPDFGNKPYAIWSSQQRMDANELPGKSPNLPNQPPNFRGLPPISEKPVLPKITTPPGVEIPKPEFPNVKDRDPNVPSTNRNTTTQQYAWQYDASVGLMRLYINGIDSGKTKPVDQHDYSAWKNKGVNELSRNKRTIDVSGATNKSKENIQKQQEQLLLESNRKKDALSRRTNRLQ